LRILCLVIAVVIAVALQATWLAMLNLPGGLAPDLVLVMTLLLGLLYGSETGLFFGLGAGFLLDLLTGGVVGIGTMVKMAAGFSAGLLEKAVYKENLLLPILVVGSGTLIFGSAELLLRMALRANYHFGWTMITGLFPLAIYNALAAPLLYRLIRRTDSYLLERAR
jgi:rod shape-determining protein MreD